MRCYLSLVMIAFLGCSEARGPESASEDDSPEQVIRRYYAAVSSPANLSALNKLVSEDFVNFGWAGRPQSGREQLVAVQERLLTAFPDRKERIDNIVVQGELVAVYQRMEGTHRGPFIGLDPTGKSVVWRRMHIWRVRDGQIVEHHAVRADLELLYQLDAIELPDELARNIGMPR